MTIKKQIDVLKAYVTASNGGKNPVGYKDVATLMHLHPTRVSGCNKFFENIGLIKSVEKQRGKFLPSNEVIEFKNKSTWDLEDAKKHVKPLIESSWFGKLTKKMLDLKESVTETELISSFGKEVGAEEDQEVNLKRLVEYLEFFNVIEKDESGNYRIPKAIKKLPKEKPEKPEFKEEIKKVIEKKVVAGIRQYNINFNLEVGPNTTKEQLKSMLKLISDVIEENEEETG